jgi:hypothetical protein
VNALIDQLIFRDPVPATRPADEWDAIVDRLVATLAGTLGAPLAVDRRDVIDGVALSCQVSTRQRVLGPLALGVTATIGLEIIERRPYANAFLFLFTETARLGTREAAESYAELVYEPAGHWRFNGWVDDGYGEFTNWPATTVH